MARKREPTTYAMAMVGQGALVIQLLGDGIEFEQAPAAITQAAIRMGVVCLNTGKSEREIFKILEGLMP